MNLDSRTSASEESATLSADIIGLKIQAYKNDASRELQDKADIQKLLAWPKINLVEVKKYADLFCEWPVIEKL